VRVATEGVGPTDAEVVDEGEVAGDVVTGGETLDVASVHPARATTASSATQRLMREL
jgi:hypothetical protein